MNLCLGTVQFGTNYGIQGNGQPNTENVYAMLNYAVDNGIRILDTAAAYGEAETVLGSYVRNYPDYAEKLSFVSKLKPDAFTGLEADKWPEAAVENAKGSLERIGISKFYAYLFHNASYIFNTEAVKALSEVKEKGLAERVGVSVYTPEEAMRALEYEEIEVIQIPYNVFDRRLDKCGFFDRCLEKGVKVFARSSLLQGLVMMDPDALPDRVKFAKDYLLKYIEICDKYNVSRLTAAICYASRKKGIDYVVFGVDNQKQLEEYIALKDSELPPEMIREIDEAFWEVEERVVNPVLWK